jgi:hypothetical protein
MKGRLVADRGRAVQEHFFAMASQTKTWNQRLAGTMPQPRITAHVT